SGDVIIPSSVTHTTNQQEKTYSVTSIAENGFYGQTGMTSVQLPSCLKNIKHGAFMYCSGLTSISLPETLNTIEYCAFTSCIGLTSVIVPAVDTIAESAFRSCSALESVVLNEGTTVLDNQAFYACVKLSSINLPSTLTSIGTTAFYQCIALPNLTLPQSLTTIGYDAFDACTTFTSMVIPDNVDSVGEFAFAQCIGLKHLTFGTGIAKFGQGPFYMCGYLETITINNTTPPSVEENELFIYPDYLYENVTLYVPEESLNAYKNHPAWGRFFKVKYIGEEEEEPSVVAETTLNRAQIIGSNNSIVVKNAQNADLAVYDAMGRTIVANRPVTETTTRISLPKAGMYIVRLGNRAQKVWVK
ncbi:MAG: leucine-rich repeat domain-containing protein, partial [Bacteroidales bacterium]|nr:leucine-rich repeat domain-containing protein [Bacteroidales bacterium]